MRRGISRYLHDRDWHSRADTILLRMEKLSMIRLQGCLSGENAIGVMAH